MNNCNTVFKILTYKRLLIENKTGHTVAVGQKLLVKIVCVRRLWSWLGKWESTISCVSWKEKSLYKTHTLFFPKTLAWFLATICQTFVLRCIQILLGYLLQQHFTIFFWFYLFHSSFYFSLAMQLHHPLMSPFSPLPSIKCPRSVSNGEEDWNSLPVTCV